MKKVEWPDVLRVVQDDAARARAIGRYKEAGFTPDDFAKQRPARLAMADALSREEDALEMQSGKLKAADRLAIQAVRRALETEFDGRKTK